jgi:hypothetical protein
MSHYYLDKDKMLRSTLTNSWKCCECREWVEPREDGSQYDECYFCKKHRGCGTCEGYGTTVDGWVIVGRPEGREGSGTGDEG